MVTLNVFNSTCKHQAATGLNASRLSSHPSAVPVVTNPNSEPGVYVPTWSSLSPATSEGDSIVALIEGSVNSTPFSTYAIPLKVVANERGTDSVTSLDAAGVRTAVGLASANLDTQLGDIPTVSEFNARTKPTADYFDSATDTVDIGKINGNATSASNLQKSTSQMIQGTVSISPSTPASNSTITGEASFYSLDITNQHNDTYIGRLIVFTSGTLIGQATDITDYTYDTGNSAGFFKTTVLTQAPSNNDTFIIV